MFSDLNEKMAEWLGIIWLLFTSQEILLNQTFRRTVGCCLLQWLGIQGVGVWVSYYIKTSTKFSKDQQHTTFNRRCRERHVVSKYLRVKPLVRTSEGHQIAHNGSRHFLGACIQECYRKICHLETDLYYQRRQLEFPSSQTTSRN